MTISEFLRELNISEEDYMCESFEPEDDNYLLEFANIRGKDINIDDVDFSIYFSRRQDINHGIRLKVTWNRNRISDFDGYMELHGDYKYVSSKTAQHKPKSWEINGLRYFCKKYKVLFSAVWEDKLQGEDLRHYFEGVISLKELLTKFENISEIDYYLINHCNSLRGLEACVRENDIFNMND